MRNDPPIVSPNGRFPGGSPSEQPTKILSIAKIDIYFAFRECVGHQARYSRRGEVLKVKISALACVLICFLGVPASTKCQGEPCGSRCTNDLLVLQNQFNGFQRVGIVIEKFDKSAENMGLSRESLRDQILVALKRDIPKVKIVEPFTGVGPVTSEVYLQITSFQTFKNSVADSVATFVKLSLKRPALIIGDDGTKYFDTATVWEKETLLHDSIDHMPSRIRDQISEDLTEFAAEYHKQNP